MVCGVFNSSKIRMKNFCPNKLRQKLKFLGSFFVRIEEWLVSFQNYLTFSIFLGFFFNSFTSSCNLISLLPTFSKDIWSGGQGGGAPPHPPLQIDQVSTRGQIMLTNYYMLLQIFRPSDIPVGTVAHFHPEIIWLSKTQLVCTKDA